MRSAENYRTVIIIDDQLNQRILPKNLTNGRDKWLHQGYYGSITISTGPRNIWKGVAPFKKKSIIQLMRW